MARILILANTPVRAIDCFGFEPSPTKAEILERQAWEREIVHSLKQFAQDLKVRHKENLSQILHAARHEVSNKIINTHAILSRRVKDLRLTMMKKKYALQRVMDKVVEPDWRKSKFELVISHIKHRSTSVNMP